MIQHGRLPYQVYAAGGLAGLSGAAIGVYLGLVAHSDSAGFAHPGQALLARNLRMAVRTVQRALRDLETRGLVELVSEGRSKSAAATYRIETDPTRLKGIPAIPETPDDFVGSHGGEPPTISSGVEALTPDESVAQPPTISSPTPDDFVAQPPTNSSRTPDEIVGPTESINREFKNREIRHVESEHVSTASTSTGAQGEISAEEVADELADILRTDDQADPRQRRSDRTTLRRICRHVLANLPADEAAERRGELIRTARAAVGPGARLDRPITQIVMLAQQRYGWVSAAVRAATAPAAQAPPAPAPAAEAGDAPPAGAPIAGRDIDPVEVERRRAELIASVNGENPERIRARKIIDNAADAEIHAAVDIAVREVDGNTARSWARQIAHEGLREAVKRSPGLQRAVVAILARDSVPSPVPEGAA